MKEIILKNSFGYKRNVGFIESGCYFTHRDKKNYFRNLNGFSISNDVLGHLNETEVYEIIIDFQGLDFKTSPLMFCASGITYTNQEGDRQKVLSLNHFDGFENQEELLC